MKFARNLMIGLAGASLLAGQAVAAPAQRGSEVAAEANGLEGDSTGWIFVLGAIAVVVLGIIAFGNGDDDPASP